MISQIIKTSLFNHVVYLTYFLLESSLKTSLYFKSFSFSSDLLPLVASRFFDLKASTCFCPWSSIVYVCFSKAFLKGE